MEKIKKIIKYLNIALIFFILIIFNKELLLPKDGPISLSQEIISSAEKRTLLIEWGSASWSGVILESGLNRIKILTIIHEDAMKKIKGSDNQDLLVSSGFGKNYKGKIKKWDSCNELSIVEIDSTEKAPFLSKLDLEAGNGHISQDLFSFGHPLGLNIHYSEGYLSSVGNKIKPCGMITNGFSGGTVPGQTGSGVWNNEGKLSGLIVATSAFPVKTLNKDGEQIGQSIIPITFLGRFVPSSEIKKFLD
jgi:S1-C subfamily serine protease